MDTFQNWFTHKGVYALPDGTPVIALWTELGDSPRWWFVAEQGVRPGQWGELLLAIYPTGRVYTYVIEIDGGYPSLAIPCLSDLCVEDIRVVDGELVLSPEQPVGTHNR